MASEETTRKSTLQVFECVMKPVPPGTKSRGRLPRPSDPEPSMVRVWWPYVAIVAATLVTGLLVGKFLL